MVAGSNHSSVYAAEIASIPADARRGNLGKSELIYRSIHAREDTNTIRGPGSLAFLEFRSDSNPLGVGFHVD